MKTFLDFLCTFISAHPRTFWHLWPFRLPKMLASILPSTPKAKSVQKSSRLISKASYAKSLLLTLLFASTLQAQTMGDAADTAVQAVKSDQWQNWTFVAVTVAVAAAAVVFLAVDNGKEDPSHH